MEQPSYTRILIKLSGQALSGPQGSGIHLDACSSICKTIKELISHQVQVAIVVGGGNIFRGIQGQSIGIDRTPADQMGMLATIINGIAIQQTFEKQGIKSRVMSSIQCHPVVESYNWQHALDFLETGHVLVFVGGTGNPYFTTDTAAALRANEIQANLILKATKVDGVYNKDPLKYPDAKRYEMICYRDVLAQNLEVMDATAIALCMKNKIPTIVYNMRTCQSLVEVLNNRSIGTLVHWENS